MRQRRLARPVIALATAALVALVTTACGSTDDDSASAAPGASGEPEKELVFAGPGAGLGDTYKKILEQYTSQHGIKLTYVEGLTTANYSKVQTQVRSKNVQIDIVQVNETLDPVGTAAGMFQQLTPEQVPNLSQLSSFAAPSAQSGPVALASPYGLFYNTEVFQKNGWPAPTSWSDLYNPTYAGCVSLPDTGSSGTNAAMLVMLNKIASGGYGDVTAGLNLLKPVASQVTIQTSSDALNAVSQGSKCLSVFTQGRVMQVAAGGAKVAYVMPKEGAPLNAVQLEVVKGAPHPVAAVGAINHFLSAEAQPEIFNAYFTPTNKNVPTPSAGPGSTIYGPAEMEKAGAFPLPAEATGNFPEWARQYTAMFAK